MSGRQELPIDLIGSTLRDNWRDIVSSPLPERLQKLLDGLERAKNDQSQRIYSSSTRLN